MQCKIKVDSPLRPQQHSFTSVSAPRPPSVVHHLRIRQYFYSGWAYLIPYLFFYLLYAWQKWPLNPLNGLPFSALRPPPLLHIYWALHGLHLVLASIALRSSWLGHEQRKQGGLFNFLWPIFPWGLLVLLFLIPGAYLEFPADPWEHYARITHWKELTTVGTDPGWFYKGHYYFLAYSLLGHLPLMWQMQGLDFFQAAISVLISWQYYRLGRACGLGIRAGMIFVLAQAVLLGNDIFGFYRYYSLSSTAFSQLGAIAAIRAGVVAVKYLSRHHHENPPSLFKTSTGMLAILSLTIFMTLCNHAQGVAIAIEGLLATLIWLGFKKYRRILFGAVCLMLAASIYAVFFWPKNPVLDTFYRGHGWLNAWYGFDLCANLFSPGSHASHRMIVILGVAGMANMIAGIFLVFRNHVVGWLTVSPLLLLQCPLIAIPLANALAAISPSGIVAYHRLFFAIPPGLALVTVGTLWFRTKKQHNNHGATATGSVRSQLNSVEDEMTPIPNSWPILLQRNFPLGLVIIACSLLVTVPASYPYFNRAFNNFSQTPDDLKMTAVLNDFHRQAGVKVQASSDKPPLLVASAGHSFAIWAYQPSAVLFTAEERLLSSRSPSSDMERIHHQLAASSPEFFIVQYAPGVDALFTPLSYSAYLSGHWRPNEVALAYTRDSPDKFSHSK